MAEPVKQLPPEKNGRKTSPRPKGRGPRDFLPKGGGFTGNLLSTVLIFILLLGLFTYIASSGSSAEEIPLSQIAIDVKAEMVTAIEI